MLKWWKSGSSENRRTGKCISRVPIFFAASETARYASSADSKRELRPGYDSRNYILRDNSIMFHGSCTHALVRPDMQCVSFYYTETSFRQRCYWSLTNDIVFSLENRHRYCHSSLQEGKITSQEKSRITRLRIPVFFISHANDMHHPQAWTAIRSAQLRHCTSWRAASVNNTISLFTSVPMRFTCIAPTFAFPHTMRAAL